jgi:hypothetical protein
MWEGFLATDEIARTETFSKGIAALLAAAGATLGLFGIKDGTLTRIILNSKVQFVAAVLCRDLDQVC